MSPQPSKGRGDLPGRTVYNETMRLGHFLILALLVPIGSLSADPKRELEVVCERGAVTEVKLYSGESLTFTARDKREGITALFGETRLDQVTFTLMEFDRARRVGTAIAQGVKHKTIREVRGVAGKPTRFTINGGRACRRLLLVKRAGFVTARVIIHLARFHLDEIWESLREDGWDDPHYTAVFEIYLEDPDEERAEIPVRIETLDAEGRLLDERTDVLLRARERWPERFRSNQRIRISTAVIETFRERVARKETAPLPGGFYTNRPLRMVTGGFLRISFLTLEATWPVPFTRMRPRPPGK